MINFRQLLGFLLLSIALCQTAWTSQRDDETMPPASSLTNNISSSQGLPSEELPSTTATASSMRKGFTPVLSLDSSNSSIEQKLLLHSKKQKETPLVVENILDLPPEVQNLILIKMFYTNPSVILVRKNFELALNEESKSIGYILKPHANKQGHLAIFEISSLNLPYNLPTRSFSVVFKSGFKGLVFNNKCSEMDCLAAHKCLRGFLKEASSFPEELKENMPTDGFAEDEITWDYLTVFKLAHRQIDYPCPLLTQMSAFLKTLETYSNDSTSKPDLAFISGSSLDSFVTGSSFPSNPDQDFTDFYKEINVTYKLILLKHQKLNDFLDNPNSVKVLKFMQNAPIGASLLSPSASEQNEDLKKAIDTSLGKLRTLLTGLAQKRWKIVSKLDLYLKLG